jgi:isopenicillin-N epimerase
MPPLKSYFLLDPDVVYLNHGSFGATPRPVFDRYQEWQRRLERQPVRFIESRLTRHLQHAREALGRYVGADGDDLLFVPNATFAVNLVARSLDLGPGDQVLASDHEYGACDAMWLYLSRRQGFDYVRWPVDLPESASAPGDLAEHIWQGVTPRTRLIFLSHITSPTAVELPVAALCARAREAGILTLIDGAHAPGQMPLDLAAVGADFYAGNCHKWLCAPKGSGFLFARRERQDMVEPLVIGWGLSPERGFHFGSQYLDRHQWLGTNDLAAYLAVPAAIDFLAEHDWPNVWPRCHRLLTRAIEGIGRITGLPPFYPSHCFYHQMAVAPLPAIADARAFRRRLYDEYRIEAPVTTWRGHPLLRLSVQAYNEPSDIGALLDALERMMT